MTAVTVQSNKIVSNEVNYMLLEPSYGGKKQTLANTVLKAKCQLFLEKICEDNFMT